VVQLWHSTFTAGTKVEEGGSLGNEQIVTNSGPGGDAVDFKAYTSGLVGLCGTDAEHELTRAMHDVGGGHTKQVLRRTPIDSFGATDSALPAYTLLNVGPVLGFPPDFRSISFPTFAARTG
jgi:hypothetical protein